MFDLTKRQKIIVASVLVTLGLLSTQLVDFNLRFRFLVALSLFTYLVSLWALWEGIDKLKALVILILPTLFTLAVASFYFLLPVRWLTRLPVAVIFGLAFYSLLLSQNVFNVAAIRTIPLYRAASTVTFLFTLITAFFIFNVIHAFNFLFIWNGLLVALISFLLILQVLWSIEMEERISVDVLLQSLVLSLSLGELAVVFSFWPLGHIMWGIILSAAMYVLLGLTTHHLKERLSKRIIWEYLIIGTAVFLIAFFATSWTG
ncbi:hypothetical protein HY387_00710 [Candidatus Daviesbacteria bacterium]|nr:hypothetical protein [Candidatus Daviesbacteria bacterium]